MPGPGSVPGSMIDPHPVIAIPARVLVPQKSFFLKKQLTRTGAADLATELLFNPGLLHAMDRKSTMVVNWPCDLAYLLVAQGCTQALPYVGGGERNGWNNKNIKYAKTQFEIYCDAQKMFENPIEPTKEELGEIMKHFESRNWAG